MGRQLLVDEQILNAYKVVPDTWLPRFICLGKSIYQHISGGCTTLSLLAVQVGLRKFCVM